MEDLASSLALLTTLISSGCSNFTCETFYLYVHLGTSIICRGIFSPRRFCRTKQEQRSSTCSQQRPLAALWQPAGTQAATAAVGNQHPPTPKAGVGHSFMGHPHRAPRNTWVTWVLLHVESAGRHLGRREGNPIADLLQQNNIRNE